MKKIFPIDVAVRQFYHVYVTAEETDSIADIKEKAIEEILMHQSSCMMRDFGMDIEEDDILNVNVREEDWFTEDEVQEIDEILYQGDEWDV